MNYAIIKKFLNPYDVYFMDITQEFVKRYGDCFAPIKQVTVYLGENEGELAEKIYNDIFGNGTHADYESDQAVTYDGQYIGGIDITFESGKKMSIEQCSLYTCLEDKRDMDSAEVEIQAVRKVLISYGMTSDMMLLLTDAPKDAIEKWAREYLKTLEETNQSIYLGDLLKYYYTKVIVDTELHSMDRDAIDYIGYDEAYDLGDYQDSE